MDGEDDVVAMLTTRDEAKILSITENGFGKRTNLDAYREIRRGGKGVRTIKVNERNGCVVALLDAEDDEEIVVTTIFGMVIRIPVQEVSLQGRDTMGVTIIRLNQGDKVTSVAKIKKEEEDEENGEDDGPAGESGTDGARVEGTKESGDP